MPWEYEAYHINSKTKKNWPDFVETQAKAGYKILGENEAYEEIYFGKWTKERFFERRNTPLSTTEIARQYTTTPIPGAMVLRREYEAGNDWVSKLGIERERGQSVTKWIKTKP